MAHDPAPSERKESTPIRSSRVINTSNRVQSMQSIQMHIYMLPLLATSKPIAAFHFRQVVNIRTKCHNLRPSMHMYCTCIISHKLYTPHTSSPKIRIAHMLPHIVLPLDAKKKKREHSPTENTCKRMVSTTGAHAHIYASHVVL